MSAAEHAGSVRCDCGGTTISQRTPLVKGVTKSCGCLSAKLSKKRFTKHGKYQTAEYTIWVGMIQRCENPKSFAYSYYGGRGIRVCERWRLFENFLEDMGPRTSQSHSIDRINNDGNYEPSNCRWATPKEQSNNQRKRRGKAACKAGHPFTADNTYVDKSGKRGCRLCLARRSREYHRRKLNALSQG